MSDGPFRSPSMKRNWRDVAERADNANYSVSDICDALPPALKKEMDDGVPGDFLGLLTRTLAAAAQTSLFGEQDTGGFAALARAAAGYPMAMLIADCAKAALKDGYSGDNAAAIAVGNALAENAASHGRVIADQCQHENLAEGRTRNILQRFDAATAALDYAGLARQLLKLEAEPVPRAAPKQTDLDDGVPINGTR